VPFSNSCWYDSLFTLVLIHFCTYFLLQDPSRNHHSYRIFASSMEAPYLPYFPLLMKDMTFQHEGNDNQKQELVNFEKMVGMQKSAKSLLNHKLLRAKFCLLFSQINHIKFLRNCTFVKFNFKNNFLSFLYFISESQLLNNV